MNLFSTWSGESYNWLQWKHGMRSKVKESALWEFEWNLVTNKWKVLLFIHAGKQPVHSGNTSAQVCSLSIWIYTMLKWEPGQSMRCPCHKKQGQNRSLAPRAVREIHAKHRSLLHETPPFAAAYNHSSVCIVSVSVQHRLPLKMLLRSWPLCNVDSMVDVFGCKLYQTWVRGLDILCSLSP